MVDRRAFLKIAADAEGIVMNDVHSQLNATRVNRIVEPRRCSAMFG
jgi:hypothetical protein